MAHGSVLESSACRDGIAKTAQKHPRFGLVKTPYRLETDAPPIVSGPRRDGGRVLQDKYHSIHPNSVLELSACRGGITKTAQKHPMFGFIW